MNGQTAALIDSRIASRKVIWIVENNATVNIAIIAAVIRFSFVAIMQ